MNPAVRADCEDIQTNVLISMYENATQKIQEYYNPETQKIVVPAEHIAYTYDIARCLGLRYKNEYKDCDHALPYLFEALKYTTYFQDKGLRTAAMLGYIGTCYGVSDNYSIAKLYFEQSAQLFQELNITIDYAIELLNLGITEANMGHFNSSIFILNKSKMVFKSIDRDDYVKGIEEMISKINLIDSKNEYGPIGYLNISFLKYPSKIYVGQLANITFQVWYQEPSLVSMIRPQKHRKLMFCCGAIDDLDVYCSTPTEVVTRELNTIVIPIRSDREMVISCPINVYIDREFPKITYKEISEGDLYFPDYEIEIMNTRITVPSSTTRLPEEPIKIDVEQNLLDKLLKHPIIKILSIIGPLLTIIGLIYKYRNKLRLLFKTSKK